MEEEEIFEDEATPPSYFSNDLPVQTRPQFNDSLGFIQELLNKDEFLKTLPPELKSYALTIIKNMAITNFDDADLRSMERMFADAKTSFLMQYPPSKYTYAMESDFTLLRIIMKAEIRRSKDGMERKLMATSITQSYQSSTLAGMPGGEQQSRGLLSRFRGFFRR